MNRFFANLIVLILIFSFVEQVSIAELNNPEPVNPQEYAYIGNVYANISISNGIATCEGSGYSEISTAKTKITTKLQRKSPNGNSWITMKTWSATSSGLNSATAVGSCNVTHGNVYRTFVTYQIKDSNGNTLETAYASRKISY